MVLKRQRFLSLFHMLVMICALWLVAPKSIIAQDDFGLSEQTQAQALAIARRLQSDAVQTQHISVSDHINALPLEPEARLLALSSLVTDIAFERVEGDLKTVNALYLKDALQLGNQRHRKISESLSAYESIRKFGPDHPESLTILKALRNFQTSEDWQVAHKAYLLESMLQGRSGNINLALNAAKNAAEIVPEGLTPTILKASYDQNSVIVTTYFILGNFELGVQATDDLISQAALIGKSVDRITLLNNIIFGADKWHEPELAAALSEISLDMAEDNDAKVIAHFRYGQALNQLKKYERAALHLKEGLRYAPSDNWVINLEVQYALAQAGLGNEAASKASFDRVLNLTKDNPRYDGKFEHRQREAGTLLAVAQNRADIAYDLMQQSQTWHIQRLLRRASNDTQKLTAMVDNSKAVQEANEAQFRAEAELREKTIDAQRRQLRYLYVIASLFATLMLAALAFSVFQRRNAKMISILKDKALAGVAAKSQFLAVMSHELRTPLNGIIGLAEILSREGPNSDVRFKNGIILKSGYMLLDLLTNILDMSKMETGKLSIDPTPTDVRDIVQSLGELWSPKSQEKGLTFTRFVADNVPERVLIDGMRLRQCIENLISNAVKFTSEGRVHLHITFETDPEIGQGSGPGILKIIVADTGQGMSEDKRRDVFEPFTQADNSITRAHGGSGLGLAITRSLARLMGGDTEVNSAPGRGSEFTLTVQARRCESSLPVDHVRPSPKENYLRVEAEFNRASQPKEPAAKPAPFDPPTQAPAHAAFADDDLMNDITAELERITEQSLQPDIKPQLGKLTQQQPSEPAQPQQQGPLPASPLELLGAPGAIRPRKHSSDPFGGLKVLIVEDVASNQDVLKIFLEPVGCEVSCASNGHEALSAMDMQDFDIVLMDVRMPEMDGVEATQIIRSKAGEQSSVPIIALTADASAENNAQCMAAGADVFLTKPVVASELFGAIRFVIKQAESRKLNKLSA